MYQRLYSSVIYPLYHWAMRDGANAAIRELDHNETLTPAKLKAVTDAKLQRLLGFACENVPYYRDYFRETGVSTGDAADAGNFCSWPLMSRATINENLTNLVSDDLEGNGLDANSTGGSTGEVLKFYTDWRSGAYRKATVRRNKRWLGVQPGEREVRLWGAPLDVKRSKSIRGSIHAAIAREKLLSADKLGEDTLASYLEICQSFRPRLLVAYPSALSEFAIYCRERGESIASLRAIICSAETLFQHDRELLESTFGVKVYNRYGCREVGDLAHEVPGMPGLIVNSDRVHVEILDEQGHPCGPGEQGEVVVTDLDNFGMPLIRYRIGDYARWSQRSDGMEVNLPFPVLESVDGRTLDVVRAPSGRRVGGTYWTLLLRSKPGFRKMQVIQTEPDAIKILYSPEPGTEPDFAYFRGEIAKTCGAGLRVDFVSTEVFEHEPGSKFRLVLRKFP